LLNPTSEELEHSGSPVEKPAMCDVWVAFCQPFLYKNI